MYLVSLTYSFNDSSYIKRQTLSGGGHEFSEFACSSYSQAYDTIRAVKTNVIYSYYDGSRIYGD